MSGTYKFTILRHKTEREHFDLVLEFEESRMSWIIPNKIPAEENERRLAIEHQGNNEGFTAGEIFIEDGYGSGEAEVWDRGALDLEKKRRDKIIFRAKGVKMCGRFIILIPVWGGRTRKRLWVLFKIPFPSITNQG